MTKDVQHVVCVHSHNTVNIFTMWTKRRTRESSPVHVYIRRGYPWKCWCRSRSVTFASIRSDIFIDGLLVGRFDYVVNGEVATSFFESPFEARFLPVITRIPITVFSFLVCIEVLLCNIIISSCVLCLVAFYEVTSGATFSVLQDMTVNITWRSMNALLGNPVLSVPTTFVYPTCPFREFYHSWIYFCNSYDRMYIATNYS